MFEFRDLFQWDRFITPTIGAEFILIVFRINEHLGAIRDQGGPH